VSIVSTSETNDPDRVVVAMTPAEERFERIRQTLGLFLGPVVFFVLLLMPMPNLSPEAHRLAAIVSLVGIWWVTETIPIPVTALVGAVLMVLLGVTTAQAALAPFASPVIFLFIGSFIIGRAISEHGLDRRAALAILSLKGVKGNLERIRIALAAFCLVISAWMSNTATTAMIIPVVLGVLASSGVAGTASARPYTSGFLLLMAYSTGVGGMMTPVGSPPNLITIGLLDKLANVRIDFITWMMLMIPIAAAMGLVLYLTSARLFPRLSASVSAARERAIEEPAGGLTAGQRHCLLAFGLAVCLWVTPGIYALLGSATTPGRTFVTRLDEGIVAIAAASLLFLLPVNWQRRQFAIGWKEASQIDWGTILLFGGGLSLGSQMFQTGLAERMGLAVVGLTGVESLWGVTALALALGIILTEFTSNTATANMLVPVVISICQTSGVNPAPAALGACVGASMARMLPISTPPNAIIYGTGYVRIMEMVRFGFLLDVIGFFIGFLGLWILCPLLGLA
jgi:sodium-dependent dicarboxylate transporter 2/3/5